MIAPSANLFDAELLKADLRGASLPLALLRFAFLHGADLTNANLSGANLRDATLGSLITPPPGATLASADLTFADLSRTIAFGVDFSGAFLSSADVSEISCVSSSFDQSDLSFASIVSVNVAFTSLDSAILVESDMSDARFAACSFLGADFTGANVSNALYRSSSLQDATGLSSTVGSALYDVCTDFTGTGFDPVSAGWVLESQFSPLITCPDQATIDLSEGGSQVLHLEAGVGEAGKLYWLVGSASGTSPGLAGPPSVPLNFDSYLVFTLQFPNQLIANSLGFLDGNSRSTAVLALPPGSDPTLAGIHLDHAFVVLDLPGTGQAVFASNPVGLDLVP